VRDVSTPVPDTDAPHLAAYELQCKQGRPEAAQGPLLDALAGAPEAEWMECARALALRRNTATAQAVLSAALIAHSGSSDLRFALAGILLQQNESSTAEAQLRNVLAHQPAHAAATFLLTGLLRQQGRMHAAACTMRQLFEHSRQDTETVIQAVEMLDDIQRVSDAAAICEAEIAAGGADPRIYAYAGMLGIQLGRFDRARERYAFTLAHSPQAVEWNIPIGLSSPRRYHDRSHADFQLFRNVLQRPDLSEATRITTLFALGKAHDDIADHAQAAHYLRQANALAHARSTWSRKRWRRLFEARLTSRLPPFQLTAPCKWTPLFIVGVPRSGTTLLAELLARHPLVCNRGELGWLATLARRLEQAGTGEPAMFEQAANTYAAQLRQGDSNARWFIDKQPLNLLHIDLILTLCRTPASSIADATRATPHRRCGRSRSTTTRTTTPTTSAILPHSSKAASACMRMHARAMPRRFTPCATRNSSPTRDPTWTNWPSGSDCPSTTFSTPRVMTMRSAPPAHGRHANRSMRARWRWRSYTPHVPELLQLPDN